MNQPNRTILSADTFRCRAYEDVFDLVVDSYNSTETHEVALYGGSSSGKTEYLMRMMSFFLSERRGHEGYVVLSMTRHKINTAAKFQKILDASGYQVLRRKNESGDIILEFGDENRVTFMSVKSSSIAEMEEKMKTVEGNFKFIWFEEFTSILSSFVKVDTFESAFSRMLRTLVEGGLVFYTFNPNPNRRHVIYDWIDSFEGMKIKTTLYDLPKKWQDVPTLKKAERVREMNPDAFETIYMGNPMLNEGLAFVIDDNIYIDEAGQYREFYWQTDEGTSNPTVFTLIGLTLDGELHVLYTWSHSSKETGVRWAMSDYAKKFSELYRKFGVTAKYIVTDGIAFQEELKKAGFNAQSMQSLGKDRSLSYTILNNMILENRFKVLRDDVDEDEDNKVDKMVEQLKYATIEYDKEGRAKVSKAAESTGAEDKYHSHYIDTLLYVCTFKQKELVRKYYV